MASKRKGKNLKKIKIRIQRGYQYISKPEKVLYPSWSKRLYPEIKLPSYKKIIKKVIIDDRRRWRPPISRGFLKIDGIPVDYILTRKKGTHGKNVSKDGRISFADSRRVEVCRRRSERRKNLFKRALIGKGKGSGKKRRWTESSKIKC